jgi:predicted nucleic acid-binding protein
MTAPRVYADTSVFGGPFDAEFDDASQAFFQQVRLGRLELVVSSLVEEEIRPAPLEVGRLFDEMLAFAQLVFPNSDTLQLRDAYLHAGIVTTKSKEDALHVALATVSRCSMIVSWNFQHIVHFRKIPLYNAVNSIRGFAPLAIHSPREVIDYEEKAL